MNMGLEIVEEEKVVKGKIEEKTEKLTKGDKPYLSIKVDGNKYNYFGDDKITTGDVVELNLQKNEQGYWNIKKLEKVGGEVPVEDMSEVKGQEGNVHLESNRTRTQLEIIRQSSMKNATNLACVFLQWRLNEADDKEKEALQYMELIAFAPQIEQLAERIEKWVIRQGI